MELLALWNKYKDIFPYAFFGVCTTAVNVVSYWLFADILKFSVMQSTVIAWTLAVLFAYVTNRKWVFKSNIRRLVLVLREIVLFFICRISTGGIDFFCMWLFVEKLNLNGVAIKFLTDLLVIVLNYLASKFVIFKSKSLSYHKNC